MDSVRFFNKDLTDFSTEGRSVIVGVLTDHEVMQVISCLDIERNYLQQDSNKLHELTLVYNKLGFIGKWVANILGFDFSRSEVDENRTTFCGIADVVFLNKL
jgi:predicted proteasome-type protease